MALIATLREVRRDVVRIRRALVVLEMAGHTGIAGQVVIVIDVAIGALPWRYRVHARQRKISRIVVEGCVRPRGGVVALRAGLREVRSHVIRIVRSLVILQMATDAGRARQIEVAIDMAIGALPGRHGMASTQWKSHRTVVEVCIQPCVHSVAGCAVGGKSPGRMAWIIRRFEIRRVARVALRR